MGRVSETQLQVGEIVFFLIYRSALRVNLFIFIALFVNTPKQHIVCLLFVIYLACYGALRVMNHTVDNGVYSLIFMIFICNKTIKT